MYTDMLMQTIRVAEIDQKRINDRLMDEQMRLARMTRPTFPERFGRLLIGIGERLQREPAPRAAYRPGEAPMARTS